MNTSAQPLPKRLMTVAYLLAASSAFMFSQNVSISAKNATLESVFLQVMKQANHEYAYNPEIFKGKTTSVTASDRPFRDILEDILRPNGISYRIKKGKVLLYSDSRKPGNESRRVTVSGFIKEKESGEALIGAVVRDAVSGAGTMTNANGFYTLSIPAGKVSLTASFLGNTPETRTFDAKKSMTVDFSLPISRNLQEVVVTADKNRLNAMETTDIGKYNLSQEMITRTPVIFGESDIVKTIQLLPGVSAGTEGLAGMFVHGGDSDENLYMLDNVPLYQVNHFGGLFSAFNTEALKDVDFYKTSFPAKYDGRLSSVLDVHTKDGSLTQWHGSAKLGLTSGAVNADGPIVKDKTSLSVALRRSWYDILTIPTLAIVNSVNDDEYTKSKTDFGYAFTDFNAKINHHFNRRSQMHLMFYYGEDYLKGGSETTGYSYDISDIKEESDKTVDKSKLRWGNIVTSLGWDYAISDKMYMQLTGSFSKYFSKITKDYSNEELNVPESENNVKWKRTDRNSITDWMARADFQYTPLPSNRLNFGADLTFHSFNPENVKRTIIDPAGDYEVHYTPGSISARQAGLYAGDDWDISEHLRLNVGLHLNYFSITGNDHFNLNPRASVRYRPNGNISFKAGFARMSQYIHQLTQSSISLPTDCWVPISGNLKPETSDQVSAGVYYNLHDQYTFSVEGYWKWSKNVVDYKDNYFLYPIDAPWDQKLCMGKGMSRGVDFLIEKKAGKFTGHISYSLLFADRKFDEKNHGMKFPARFDNRHKINVMLNWRINKKWEINAAWTGMSGNMFTLALQNYEMLRDPGIGYPATDSDAIYEGVVDLVGKTNNMRLPFYHRLDIGANRYTKHGFWNFSLYNAYCNMNVIALVKDYPRHYLNTKGGFKKLRLIPLIPSVSYTWKF